MDQRFVPIRPAAPAAGDDERNLGLSEPLEPKRRRVGVSVACNACRRKKIRCNGLRPTCSNCSGESGVCIYRDNADLSIETRKAVVYIIKMLNSLPEIAATRVLASLQSERNASAILAILESESKSIGSIHSSEEVSNSTARPFEFVQQNPVAYPTTSSFSLEGTSEQSYTNPKLFSKQVEEQPSVGSESTSSSQSFQMSNSAGGTSQSSTEAAPSDLCDHRLEHLNIQAWTSVRIGNDTAARCISLYLETDHPLLGHFDPELFVSGLVFGTGYCSSLLVNALLYWACQMYSYIDPKIERLVPDFCCEAERLWTAERMSGQDSVTSIAAAQFIGLGYLGQGKDHAILTYISDASEMGTRMGLFGGEDDHAEETDDLCVFDDSQRARMFAAWGVFNWITLMSLFYRQPGSFCPKFCPSMAIPECGLPSTLNPEISRPPSLDYMGDTFPHICQLWRIVHEVSMSYQNNDERGWGSRTSFQFAEYKFRELLAWSSNLPSHLIQRHDSPHHVQVMHLWFHTIILDIFRPFTQVPIQHLHHLRTFSGRPVAANDVCAASVAELKHLITQYRLRYKASKYTILWQTALISAVNAILDDKGDTDWYNDLLMCIYAYKSLSRAWRVAACISKGLLSLAMRKSELKSGTALSVLKDLRNGGYESISGELRAMFMADLNLALSDPTRASMEYLASHFEENMWLKDYTTLFEQ